MPIVVKMPYILKTLLKRKCPRWPQGGLFLCDDIPESYEYFSDFVSFQESLCLSWYVCVSPFHMRLSGHSLYLRLCVWLSLCARGPLFLRFHWCAFLSVSILFLCVWIHLSLLPILPLSLDYNVE